MLREKDKQVNNQDFDEQKARRRASDQATIEYERADTYEHTPANMRSLLSTGPRRGTGGSVSSVNQASRASAMHDMQRTVGNRAVQRVMANQTASDGSLAVQRQVPPTEDPDKGLREAESSLLDVYGDQNFLEAIPGLGNIVSGAYALGGLGAAGLFAIEGKDRETDMALSEAGFRGMHAIPILGNILAGRDAYNDYQTSEQALSGKATSEDGAVHQFEKESMWEYMFGK